MVERMWKLILRAVRSKLTCRGLVCRHVKVEGFGEIVTMDGVRAYDLQREREMKEKKQEEEQEK
jgi:hypothetical protein